MPRQGYQKVNSPVGLGQNSDSVGYGGQKARVKTRLAAGKGALGGQKLCCISVEQAQSGELDLGECDDTARI